MVAVALGLATYGMLAEPAVILVLMSAIVALPIVKLAVELVATPKLESPSFVYCRVQVPNETAVTVILLVKSLVALKVGGVRVESPPPVMVQTEGVMLTMRVKLPVPV